MKKATRLKKIKVLLESNVKLWNRYRKIFPHKIDFSMADLRGANLQSANLQSANLQDANLRGANLQGADLQGANLRSANLQDANLRSANLRGADLQGANLRSADLQSTDLRGADLYGSDLQKADFDFSSLPLWCGGQGAKIDSRLAKQFLAHALSFECDDEEYKKARDLLKDYCKTSHIAKHVTWLGGEK